MMRLLAAPIPAVSIALCLLLRLATTNAFAAIPAMHYSYGGVDIGRPAAAGARRRRRVIPLPPNSMMTTPATTPTKKRANTRGLSRATMLPPHSVSAAATLVVASVAGYTIDRQRLVVPNFGIVATLCLAAVASNVFRVAPFAHVLYDGCWSVALPTSFALLMLSLHSSSSSSSSTTNSVQEQQQEQEGYQGRLYRVGYSFLLASLGSVLGCLLSYKLCCFYPAFFLLTAVEAAQVTSCLAASFVGGSINFFETAAAIPPMNPSLLTAMATADIFVMAVYFAGLSMALNSTSLRRLFPIVDRSIDQVAPTTAAVKEVTAASTTTGGSIREWLGRVLPAWRSTGLPSLVAMSLALSFTGLAKMLERLVNAFVPGTSCAFLAVMIPLFLRRAGPAMSPRLRNDLRTVAEPLSALSFLLLFASIGASVDLQNAAVAGLPCLVISLVALVCHAIVTLFGSALLVKNGRLEEALVASNAAIGGPATAAAFCSQCGGQYALAATVFGVVGYAIGTTIGVTMYRFLA
jgi:uncharacterized membrane protein